MKITCVGSGCVATAEVHGSIPVMERKSGFFAFFLNDGGLAWICSDCWLKLWPAFSMLHRVLGKRASEEPVHFLVRRWRDHVKG